MNMKEYGQIPPLKRTLNIFYCSTREPTFANLIYMQLLQQICKYFLQIVVPVQGADIKLSEELVVCLLFIDLPPFHA